MAAGPCCCWKERSDSKAFISFSIVAMAPPEGRPAVPACLRPLSPASAQAALTQAAAAAAGGRARRPAAILEPSRQPQRRSHAPTLPSPLRPLCPARLGARLFKLAGSRAHAHSAPASSASK